jgi:coiled-coil domain-containing protein 12
MSSHEKLAAAANDRKSRLAQLKSLKRKQAPDDASADASEEGPSISNSSSSALATTNPESSDATKSYLSGRNYDPETRNAKLGFQDTPIADPTSTLEYKASQLALQTKRAQEQETTEDKPLDLFKLQPKKANWDLKRDLELKMKPVDVWTENAIARIVRTRVEGAKKTIKENRAEDGGEGEEVGMEGEELVEVIALKEKEEEESRKREADEDAADVS